MNNIEISPKAIGGQSFLYGVMVKTAEDWIKDELPHREYVVGAKFLAALLIMISTNLESSEDGAEEAVASFAIDLYLNRKVVLEDGNSFVFPEWESDVSDFDRDLGDVGMFAVFSSMGFKLGFDPIANSKLIYPYRPLILKSAREGYLLTTPQAQDYYAKAKGLLNKNPGFVELVEALCDAIS